MHRILNDLGYIKIFELNKYRTEYRLDDITFDIDEYVGLDPILEIESTSYEKVEKYTKKLGIKEKDVGRIYIREILAAKKKVDKDKVNWKKKFDKENNDKKNTEKTKKD